MSAIAHTLWRKCSAMCYHTSILIEYQANEGTINDVYAGRPATPETPMIGENWSKLVEIDQF